MKLVSYLGLYAVSSNSPKGGKYEVVNWGMYGIYQTPTFEFGGRRIAGYKTFEELRQLLGCNA